MRQQAISLAGFTTWKVGGVAKNLAEPDSLDALRQLLEEHRQVGEALQIIGAGSNLLISDAGLPGLVICTRRLQGAQLDSNSGVVEALAGEPLPSLARRAAKAGLGGLEWSVGIPGTVGGAVVMNAGAHNSCIADMLVSAQVLSPDGTLTTLTPEELGYTYRSSLLQGGKRIVTQATFQLQPGADPMQVIDRTKEHKKHRLSTQPYSYPSCGSVFRNPQPYTAGWLIEQTGLKGYQLGGAQVAQLHANFIVNRGGAKASDIFSLIRHIQNEVQEHWSIWLEPEVKMLGEFPVCY